MNKETHRERFNSVAGNYKSDAYPGRYNCLLFVLDYLAPTSSDIVLDVGCGPGTQLIDMALTIKFGFGIDISEEMIHVAINRANDKENLKFLVSSAETLPAEMFDSGINKIYSNYALHHLSDRAKSEAINQLASVLGPGGRFVLGDLMLSDASDQYASLFDYVGYGPGSDTPSTVSDLEAMFKKSGLDVDVRLLNPVSGVIIGTKR